MTNATDRVEAKLRVMVVDDSRLSRRVILADLEKIDGLELSIHDDPIDALNKVDEFQPELIISDHEMPSLSGFDFCARIRSHATLAEIPFIIISGNADVDFHVKALNAGVNETILKGFCIHDLGKLVERYLSIKLGGVANAVLIVDDSRLNRSLMSKMLEDLNIRIYQAASVAEGEVVLDTHSVDLILVDQEMPTMKGSEWCEQLKRDPKTSDIGIISVSATKEAALEFLKAGANEFISKPYTKEEVVIKIQHQFNRIEMEKGMKALIEKEKALNHQKNLLLGTAAHDLRNPLATIISYLSLVKDNQYEDEYTGMSIECSLRQAQKALSMLDEILDVSNINSGFLVLKKNSCDLAGLCQEQIRDMSNLARKKSIQLNFNNLVAEGDSTLGMVDQQRLSQVLDNLLSNAIKYSHPNTETDVRLARSPEGWLIQVADGGQGIPEDEIEGLFAEFKKTSVKTTAGETSTGLGLAIVKKIVEAHCGVIWAESKSGVGTTISFTIPFDEETSDPTLINH